MAYIYPLKGIIESDHIETLLGGIHEAIMRDKKIPQDRRLIQAARTEFFSELNRGENEFHDFMIDLFFPFLDEYKILWKVKGRCDKHPHAKAERKERLNTPHKIQTVIYKTNDEQRTRKFMPYCGSCGKRAYPIKSFFIYNPLNSDNPRWAEIRVKEASAKLTDKVFELRPLRAGSIQNDVGEVVQDLFAGRVVVESYDTIMKIAKNSKNSFGPHLQLKNYHKENGYNAVHEIGTMGPDGRICEVQLKTFRDHNLAENPRSKASHDARENEITRIRINTPRWQEVWEVIRHAVSPDYTKIYHSR